MGESSPLEVFLARQPIFDAYQQVHAYELLYRASEENRFTPADASLATSTVITHTFLTLGVERVTGGKTAFINFPRALLLSEVPSALPTNLVVIEILEDIKPDAEVLAAVRKLKQGGYAIALDDFALLGPEYEPLLELADVVKVDFRSATPEQRRALAQRSQERGPHLLAEKVETDAEFREAVELGYRYFQGFFFAKPQMVRAKGVPGFKLNYLRLLQRIQAPSINYDEVERVLKAEGALVHWLLKRVNSASFGFKSRINSIRHALMALGEKELKRWVSVFCVAGMGEDRPQELVVQAFVRAHFCEQVCGASNQSKYKSEAFLVGMLSLLDAVLCRPRQEVVKDLPLTPEALGALLQNTGPLAALLDCAVAYERGEWEEVRRFALTLGVAPADLGKAYLDALLHAQELFGETPAPAGEAAAR